jgi:cytochrome bd-type quinol oxidase subunit 2
MWLAGPVAVVAFIVVAVHLIMLRKAEMPASRRRIRLATGSLMIVTIPLVLYAFAIVTPGQERQFTLAWVGVVALILLVLVLAVLDLFNTWRLNNSERTRLRTQTFGSAKPRDNSPGSGA